MSEQVFHSYPQRYPKTRRKAIDFLQQVHAISKKGPRTLVATIVDTTYHATQGYVSATTELGIVMVYGIPYGTVVPRMRVFCRQMGGHATNRAYVFDGYAPNVSGLGMTSGSLAMTTTTSSVSPAPKPGSLASLTAPTTNGAAGYYWHCFFYVPSLPSSMIVLWQFSGTGGNTNVLSLEYLPTGKLQVISQDGHGYITTGIVPPHVVHWVLIQPNNTGNEFLVDGLSAYTGIQSSGDDPTFTGNSLTYALSLLSDTAGASVCPVGSWVSKFGWGTSLTGVTVVALSASVPQSDSDLPSHTLATTTNPSIFLLMSDGIGGSSLPNTAPGASNVVTVSTSYATVLSTGPY